MRGDTMLRRVVEFFRASARSSVDGLSRRRRPPRVARSTSSGDLAHYDERYVTSSPKWNVLLDGLAKMDTSPPMGFLWMENDPCVYCAKYRRIMTWDHITPRSQGGRNSNNLARACNRCNGQKSSHGPVWLLLRRVHDLRISREACLEDVLRKRFGVTRLSLRRQTLHERMYGTQARTDLALTLSPRGMVH